MGLLDHYRQYSGMSDQEISAQLRARADGERRRALARIERLDLSRTTWHAPPHADVAEAITFAARRALNDPPDPRASALRAELGRRHGIEPDRIAVGNGIAQLLESALGALLGPGDELLTPWPSHPLLPLLARRAGARAVPLAGAAGPDALLAAIGPATRAIALCNPNDPTGAHLRVAALERLLAGLPGDVMLLLDEALADYVDGEAPNASLALLDDHPQVLVFRTLSKAYGLAGLRCGWVLAPPGQGELLSALAPPQGLPSPIEAGALAALRACGPQVAARRAQVATERRRLVGALGDLGVDAPPSEANFLWLRARGMTGAQLAAGLDRAGVAVAPGADVGDDDHVRAAVRDRAASDRLLDALGAATARSIAS